MLASQMYTFTANKVDKMASKVDKVDKTHKGTAFVYAIFLATAGFVYHKIAEGEFSSVLTIAAIFQCLAFSLLIVQVLTGCASGISAKSLQLDAIAFASRLSATTWLDGYVPFDSTGDWLYQAFDVVSLVMALWLVHHVHQAQRRSHEADEDRIPVLPFAVACFVLAGILHSDVNDNPLFDSLWMNGLFTNAIAVVPQLWLMTHRKGNVPALTSHFVAVMGLSRILTGAYMWHAYDEITCEPWIGTFNHAAPAVLASHVVHLLLLGDFGYFYVKNIAESGLEAPLPLWQNMETTLLV